MTTKELTTTDANKDLIRDQLIERVRDRDDLHGRRRDLAIVGENLMDQGFSLEQADGLFDLLNMLDMIRPIDEEKYLLGVGRVLEANTRKPISRTRCWPLVSKVINEDDARWWMLRAGEDLPDGWVAELGHDDGGLFHADDGITTWTVLAFYRGEQ